MLCLHTNIDFIIFVLYSLIGKLFKLTIKKAVVLRTILCKLSDRHSN